MDYLHLYMEDIQVNEISISTFELPLTISADHLAATEPFVHADRKLSFHVMIYVTRGCIYVTEDDEDFEVREGELLFLKSGIRHYGKREIPLGTEWYYAHFELPVLCRPPACKGVNLPKKLSGLKGSVIEQRIREFTDCLHDLEPSVRWNANSRLYELLGECAFRSSEVRTKQSLSDRIADCLNDLKRRPFSSEALENSFFLSYKYMAAVFKSEKGKTMQQYHNMLRMQEACRLLRSTLMSVGEVSDALGFSDRLYFTKCFSRYHRESPTEYRRRVLAEAGGAELCS